MYLFIFNAAVVSLLLSSVSAGPAIPKRECEFFEFKSADSVTSILIYH